MHSTDTNYVIANNAAKIISRTNAKECLRGNFRVRDWLHNMVFTLRQGYRDPTLKVCDLDGTALEVYVDQQIEFLVTHGIKYNTTQEYERGL